MQPDKENVHTVGQQMSALMQLDLFGLEQTNWHNDMMIQKRDTCKNKQA